MIVGLIPTAGLSRRMGRPKLVLNINGEPLIVRVITAMRDGGANRVVVVAPPLDQEGATFLVDLVRQALAEVVILPSATSDMHATLEWGLAYLEKMDVSISGVLIAPGDSVGMTSDVVGEVVRRFQADPSRIVVPVFGSKRGHPLALPWEVFAALRTLAHDVGLNTLVRERSDRVVFVEIDDPQFMDDMDTPEEYARHQRE